MFRFSASLFLCLGMAGCVTQPGEELNAAAVEPQPVAIYAEPLTKVVSNGRGSLNTPLPPRRPESLTNAAAGNPQPAAAEEGQTIVGQTAIATGPAPVVAASRLVQLASLAPIAVNVPAPAAPASAQAFAPTNDAPARPALVRAAYTPGQAGTTFDRSTRAYGYLPPLREEEGLRLVNPEDSRFAVPQNVRLSTTPGQRYYAAYSNTIISCFPERLRAALNTVAENYGKEVEVTSGHRHGGRRGSYHRKCMAADIRVAGVSPGQLAAFAKTIQGVNGVGTYRHNNVVHVDIRESQMSWRY